MYEIGWANAIFAYLCHHQIIEDDADNTPEDDRYKFLDDPTFH